MPLYNPLALLTLDNVIAFQQEGKFFLVRQQYERGLIPGIKGSFLFTHYSGLEDAQTHYNAIFKDRQRLIYNLKVPEQLEKVKIAAGQPSGYRIYGALLKGINFLNRDMKRKIEDYITDHMDWHPTRNDDLHIGIALEYGEFFVKVRWKHRNEKVLLSEIEKT